MDQIELAARVDAEVIAKPVSDVIERLERLGLPAAAVQGDHQEPAGPLAEGMPGDECGQVRYQLGRSVEREHQVGAIFGRPGAQFVEPLPLSLGERAGYTRERGTAPHTERLVHLEQCPG